LIGVRVTIAGCAMLAAACLLLGPCGGRARASLPAAPVVDAVRFISPSVGWVSTQQPSRLLMTIDGGRRWTDVSPPPLRAPYRILAGGLGGAAFLSASDFWASVFDSGLGSTGLRPVVLLHTTDGGRSWAVAGTFPRDYGDAWIDFLNVSRGWLMVGNGAAAVQEAVTIYQTTNGGARWARLALGASPMTAGTPGAPSPGCDKSGIGFSSPLSGWIAGDCDGPLVLQHTVDGGRRWSFVRLTPAATSAQPSYGGDTFPPVFFGPARGVIAAQLDSAGGLRDAFYATANGGVTWTLHRPPLAVGGPAFPLSTDDWFAAGGRTLAITTDAGATWSQIPASIVFGYGEPDTLDFATPLIGWTVTTGGRLWHTTDGGRTWSASSP
jgi:photosystem II stability/assembly factor-like uncharacterized protein